MKRYVPLFAAFLLCLALTAPVTTLADEPVSDVQSVTIPQGADSRQVKDIMAGLTDEQVRNLLIKELAKEAAPAPAENEPGGLARFVRKMKSGAAFVRDRFEYLFSGASTAHMELPQTLQQVFEGDERMSPGRLLLAVAFLTGLWLVAMHVFKRKTAAARKSIARLPEGSAWFTRMGRLFLRAVLDVFGIVLIGVIVFVCYLTLFSQGAAGKPIIVAWLAAIVLLSMVKVVARFLLAPHAPDLRYLPLGNHVAQTLFRYVVRVSRVMATGLLVTTLIRLEGGSEALFLLISAIFGFAVAFTLALMALWNKKPVADHIRATQKPDSLLYNFADAWHVGAIAYVFGFWACWLLALMVFGTQAMLSGVVTLLIVPAYFLVDWVTQRLVAFAVDLAESTAPKPGEDEEAKPGITRFQHFLSRGFRGLVLAAGFLLLLRVWGVDFTLGRETVRACINILITLVLAYIFWLYIAHFIERKLKEKQGAIEQGESGEGGGGPGGDRLSTLLQLVKKFIFASISVITTLIILSAMGVDIGPLIAGASIFGIAIGFGAQTLVKDIISGIFFLMDDAFRVGDYIIVGGARGTVEAISVRSFKLRHHLGPLYTIPFGSIKEIQNMSRDWAIMKLKYLVPFDTDIQQVKKIIKKINKEVRAIPELNEFMLDDIKSQGVKAMEEYGMLMRVKFMTRPGGQFTLRKLVLAKMRKEFEAAGIEFAKPRVSVHIPQDTVLTPEEEAKVAAAASKAAEGDRVGEEG